MEPIVTYLLYAALLFVISLAGAYIPRYGSLKDSRAHMMIALSAGIFLGLLFFMLLPEAIEESEEGGWDVHESMIVLVLGFIAILIIDKVLSTHHHDTCECHDHDDTHSHRLITESSFIGLAIHAACDGLALGALFTTGAEIGFLATVGLCIHKFVELFSLSSTMVISDISKKHAVIDLVVFALITPIAGLLFFLLFDGMEVEGMLGLPLMFASGTLMYVSVCELLPESFHRDKGLRPLLIVLAGIAIMLALALLFPHTH